MIPPLASIERYSLAHPWNAIALTIEIEFWKIQATRLRHVHLVNAIVESFEHTTMPCLLAVACVYDMETIDMDRLVDDLAEAVMPGLRYAKYQQAGMRYPRILLNQMEPAVNRVCAL